MHSYVHTEGVLKQCGNSTLRCPPQIFWHRPIAPLSSHLILILPFCAERPTVNYRKLELLLHQRCHRRDAEFPRLGGPLLHLGYPSEYFTLSVAHAFIHVNALKEFGKWCSVSNSVMHRLHACNESRRDFPRLEISLTLQSNRFRSVFVRSSSNYMVNRQHRRLARNTVSLFCACWTVGLFK